LSKKAYYLFRGYKSTEISDGLSLAFGILGVLLGIFFYIRSKREKLPCYSIYSRNIIREYVSSIENLEIKYSGQKIKNLTISRIVFWNKGKEVINWNDNVESAPLSIRVRDGYEILGSEIIVSNESTNMFSFVKATDKTAINVKFDYISKDNGFIAIVYHTGKYDDDIEICGKIKGAYKIGRIDVDTLNGRIDNFFNLVYGIIFSAICIPLYFIIKAIFNYLSIFIHFTSLASNEVTANIIGAEIFTIFLFFIIIKDSKVYEKFTLKLKKEIINKTSILPSDLGGFILESDRYDDYSYDD
jgi:hypothetical protein